jgi:hypothetical protein
VETVPQPGDVLWQVADLIARCATLREALDDRYYTLADAIAERQELDLIALRERLEREQAA